MCGAVRCIDQPCVAGATCQDTISGFYCSPVLLSNFTILAGASKTSTAQHPQVNSTSGGQLIQLVVNMGNMTTVQSITYSNNTINAPAIPCALVSLHGLGNGVQQITCALTGGVGCGSRFSLTACQGAICLAATQTTPKLSFCFPKPSITSGVRVCSFRFLF